jgi:hypothetical protein
MNENNDSLTGKVFKGGAEIAFAMMLTTITLALVCPFLVESMHRKSTCAKFENFKHRDALIAEKMKEHYMVSYVLCALAWAFVIWSFKVYRL